MRFHCFTIMSQHHLISLNKVYFQSNIVFSLYPDGTIQSSSSQNVLISYSSLQCKHQEHCQYGTQQHGWCYFPQDLKYYVLMIPRELIQQMDLQADSTVTKVTLLTVTLPNRPKKKQPMPNYLPITLIHYDIRIFREIINLKAVIRPRDHI